MPEVRICSHCGIRLVLGRADHVRRSSGYLCVRCYHAELHEPIRPRSEAIEARQPPVVESARTVAVRGARGVKARLVEIADKKKAKKALPTIAVNVVEQAPVEPVEFEVEDEIITE